MSPDRVAMIASKVNFMCEPADIRSYAIKIVVKKPYQVGFDKYRDLFFGYKNCGV